MLEETQQVNIHINSVDDDNTNHAFNALNSDFLTFIWQSCDTTNTEADIPYPSSYLTEVAVGDVPLEAEPLESVVASNEELPQVSDNDSLLDFDLNSSVPTDVDAPDDHAPSPVFDQTNVNTSSSQLSFGSEESNRIRYRLVRYKFIRNPVIHIKHSDAPSTSRLRIRYVAGEDFILSFLFKENEIIH
jgi:hypothetical protein